MDQVNVPEDVARVEWMVMSGFPDCMSLIVTVLPTLPVVVHVRLHDCPAVHCVGAVVVMEAANTTLNASVTAITLSTLICTV